MQNFPLRLPFLCYFFAIFNNLGHFLTQQYPPLPTIIIVVMQPPVSVRYRQIFSRCWPQNRSRPFVLTEVVLGILFFFFAGHVESKVIPNNFSRNFLGAILQIGKNLKNHMCGHVTAKKRVC